MLGEPYQVRVRKAALTAIKKDVGIETMSKQEEFTILIINNLLLMQMFSGAYKICEQYQPTKQMSIIFKNNFYRMRAIAAEGIFHLYKNFEEPQFGLNQIYLAYEFLFEAFNLVHLAKKDCLGVEPNCLGLAYLHKGYLFETNCDELA